MYIRRVGGIFKSIGNTGRFEKILIAIIGVEVVINLVGALGPELAFDSLWYHLTLPKLYLENGSVFHIPGGLLYYSDMPKLLEMIYVPALLFGGETLAKITHFLFGIGCVVVLYHLSRKFLSRKLSLFVVIAFYANLVVGWLSITSYVDLGRTFFVLLALYYFVDYVRSNKISVLIVSSIMLGLAITTKILSGVDIAVFIILILLFKKSIKDCLIFSFTSLMVPLPWFIFAYINTGNPFYPFFSSLYPVSSGFHIGNVLNFLHSPDPISPIYLICLPIIVLVFRKMTVGEKIIVFYSLFSFIAWFFMPQSGGGRFLAAYLPAFSLISVVAANRLKNVRVYVLWMIIFIAVVNIVYRGAANAKYLPVIFGSESKARFLTRHLNFSFGDFYDTDGYLGRHIKNSDRVLTVGIHNLYYVRFPFIDESYLTPNTRFNYILVRGVELPDKFNVFKKVYKNDTTGVRLYKRE